MMAVLQLVSLGMMAVLQIVYELGSHLSSRAAERAAVEAMLAQAMADASFHRGVAIGLGWGLLAFAAIALVTWMRSLSVTRRRRLARSAQCQVAVEAARVGAEWTVSRPLKTQVGVLSGTIRSLREDNEQHLNTTERVTRQLNSAITELSALWDSSSAMLRRVRDAVARAEASEHARAAAVAEATAKAVIAAEALARAEVAEGRVASAIRRAEDRLAGGEGRARAAVSRAEVAEGRVASAIRRAEDRLAGAESRARAAVARAAAAEVAEGRGASAIRRAEDRLAEAEGRTRAAVARAAAAEARAAECEAAESRRAAEEEARRKTTADLSAARRKATLRGWARRLVVGRLRIAARRVRDDAARRRLNERKADKGTGGPARTATASGPSATARGAVVDSAAGRVGGIAGVASKEQRAAMKLKTRRLTNVKGLVDLRKPTLTGVKPWFGGHLLQVADDGNCTGSSQMALALVWGVQERDRLDYLVAHLNAAEKAGAFATIDVDVQGHVDAFRAYVNTLGEKCTAGHGPAFALEVIDTLLGRTADRVKGHEEPGHVALHRSIVVVSRLLDLWRAPGSITDDDLGTLKRINSAVEMTIAGAESISMRPGGSLSLVVGLTCHHTKTGVDGKLSLVSPDVVKIVSDADASQPIVDGLTMFRGGLPHYDVLVSSGSPLGEALASTYGAALPDDDPDALQYLRRQEESQVVHTLTDEEVLAICGPEALAEQLAAQEEIEARKRGAAGTFAGRAAGASGAGASGQPKTKGRKRGGGRGGRTKR